MTEANGKVIPKFKTEFLENQAPKHFQLKKLKHWCSEFHRLELAPLYPSGSFGNLSFRTKAGSNRFIITASGLALKTELTDDCFVEVVEVDLDKQVVQVHGNKAPSSESLLHSMIYQQRQDINAIFHGHSEEILASGHKLKLPTTAQEEPYGSLALVNSALLLALQHDFFILNNHGFVSLGKNMTEAGEQARTILNKCLL